MPDLRILACTTVLTILLAACGPTPGDVNNSGREPFLQGDYQTALELYEAERAPDAPEPDYNSGNALYRMGEYGESLQRYDVSLLRAREELRANGFFNRGNTSFNLREYGEAIEAYKEVLRMNPADADAKHNLELALLQIPPQSDSQAQEQDDRQQNQSQEQVSQQPPPQRPQSMEPQSINSERAEQEADSPQDQQPQDDRQHEQVSQQEASSSQAMSGSQARHILESVGEEAQTLQERRGQVLVSPNPPSEFDW